jgi:hypothetical protein
VSPGRAVSLSLAFAGALATWGAPPPVDAGVVNGIRKDLERIEDQLHHGDWQPAKEACDRVLRDMIAENAHGKGAGPLFGLTFAFRALAESGSDDLPAAAWDWSVAKLLSRAATSFDLARFQTAGPRLSEYLSAPRPSPRDPKRRGSAFGGGDIVPPKRISGEPPHVPEAERESGSPGDIVITAILDATGRLTSAYRVAHESALTDYTSLVVSALESMREWRFEPAKMDGRPITIYYSLTIHYR